MGVPEDELTPNVQRALLSLMGEVDQLRVETERLRGRMRDLESLADHDALLPVLNRRAFLREVSKAVSLADRHGAPSALIYLDLNGFKKINDDCGHAAGDAALNHVAALLSANVRETDAVGRLGGDEFGVVLTLTPPKAAEAKAEELVRIIEAAPFVHDGCEHPLSAAWGAQALTGGIAAEKAMAEADAAMYARKLALRRAAG
ncbi:MAG: GGDEF domain-containing protein [Maricaulaceae bacterium]|nr:GGDEF domain-containing protein [Maricaulaceae bacterium]